MKKFGAIKSGKEPYLSTTGLLLTGFFTSHIALYTQYGGSGSTENVGSRQNRYIPPHRVEAESSIVSTGQTLTKADQNTNSVRFRGAAATTAVVLETMNRAAVHTMLLRPFAP